jgi:integrase
LTWDKVDLKEGAVRLEADETKNEEAREFYMGEELLNELKALFVNRRRDSPFVFQRNGQPIKDFRAPWASACNKVGLSGRFFHDFRRTACRNMVRAGTPERVAMIISGHKTRSVFERYNIVSYQDLKDAVNRQKTYYQKQEATVEKIKRGEVIPFKKSQGE